MPQDNLNPENNVHGAFTLEKQRLKFRTGDVAMVQRLKVAQAADAPVSVCLLAANRASATSRGDWRWRCAKPMAQSATVPEWTR